MIVIVCFCIIWFKAFINHCQYFAGRISFCLICKVDCVSHCWSRHGIHSNIYTETPSHLWLCVELFGSYPVSLHSEEQLFSGFHLVQWYTGTCTSGHVSSFVLLTQQKDAAEVIYQHFSFGKNIKYIFNSALVFCAFGLCRCVPEIIKGKCE